MNQTTYTKLRQEIYSKIKVPKFSKEDIETAIKNICSQVNIIRYEFFGDKNTQSLNKLFIESEDGRESYYEQFYDSLKDWFILEFSKANPQLAKGQITGEVFKNYMEYYLSIYINEDIFTLDKMFSIEEWTKIFFENTKTKSYNYESEDKKTDVVYRLQEGKDLN